MCGTDVFLLLLAVLFPPISVWIKRGICSVDSLINIALCCLGFIPGLIHAWYIVLRYPEPEEYSSLSQHGDPEGGRGTRVTYYYVSHGGPPRRQAQPKYQRGGESRGAGQQSGYGTLANGAGASQPVQPAQPAQQFPGQESGTSNAFAAGQQTVSSEQPQAGSSSQPAEQDPPSYEAATAGDHKVQMGD